MEDEDDDYYDDYESGPFCRHFAELGDCDEVCKNCGHSCGKHSNTYDEEDSSCDECDCNKWVESE